LGNSLLMLANVDDSTLSSLYKGAAFCLYPSQYEGFGLPIVEAFLHGRAVIASTGGAIPDVVGEFSPCLDPSDEEAWYTTFRRWIIDPNARVPYEEAIRARFTAVTWSDAAQNFFQMVEGESRRSRDVKVSN
jgi:glycosyltransferase involved in cell wall biosynthesis